MENVGLYPDQIRFCWVELKWFSQVMLIQMILKSACYNLFQQLWQEAQVWHWSVVFKVVRIQILLLWGFICASFSVDGTLCSERERLIILTRQGAKVSTHSLSNHVGMGSSSRVLLGHDLIICLISSAVVCERLESLGCDAAFCDNFIGVAQAVAQAVSYTDCFNSHWTSCELGPWVGSTVDFDFPSRWFAIPLLSLGLCHQTLIYCGSIVIRSRLGVFHILSIVPCRSVDVFPVQ